ncbi:MAG TPA: F0F1 ATP synthase subunit gamma [Alphaproteobacteria bacterium]|nr:F0F1 ATP synthase subunit gamma [Alphaproteobacteria bacterium]
MPSLKDLKLRIESVKSTRKITSAMKMVAASKFRRAQEAAEATRPYAEAMARIMASLTSSLPGGQGPKLLAGSGKKDRVALVVVTSDRGLCGAFNAQVVREARKQIRALEAEGREVKLICAGRKGRDLLRREHGKKIIAYFDDMGRKRLGFSDAEKISRMVLEAFAKGDIDEAYLVYNRFKNVLTQIVTMQQLVPVPLPKDEEKPAQTDAPPAPYEYEPDEESILADLLPRNVGVQLYKALLESAAGEQGARMTAMDNATRNAGEMIGKLTLQYNRARQAYITKEMIEIVTGAEAV